MAQSRTCRVCELTKPVNEFEKTGKASRRHRCKECQNAAQRKRYAQVKDTKLVKDNRRRYYINSKYGLTPAEYDALLNEPCAICGKRAEHLDHSHATGEIRGALCGKCNKGLGLFDDSAKLLDRAFNYLRERE